MKSVLFVDDEPNVLAGLRRMLHPMRHEWTMTFVDGGAAALECLAGEACDVVVSDIRMPGMDGVELLKAVAERCPRAVRIALSGHAETEIVLESVRAAHQYLAKPCDADTLKTTIDRACGLQALLADPELGNLMGRLDSLPSLPTLYVELMEEITRPESSLSRVGEIMGRDVAMSAKILQLVNSAFFGLRRPATTPERCATVLGIEVIKGLVLSVKVFSEFDGRASDFDIEALWRHSARTGALAKQVAALEGQDSRMCETAFTAGMLHDLGKLVLANGLAERYREVNALKAAHGLDDMTAEHRVFGCTHSEVGAYLLGLWGLPSPVVEALAYHHVPRHAVGEVFTPLTAVHVADALVHARADAGEPEAQPAERLDRAYLERLGLAARIDAWCSLAQAQEDRPDE